MSQTQTHHPITNAVVTRIRAGSFYSQLTGIYQGFAPEKAKYPFATYSLAAGAYDYLFGTDTTLIAIVDVTVFSKDPVEAEDLDRAIAGWLSDQPFPVEGQTTLLCRRIGTVPTAPDVDDEGNIVYAWGGTYEIQTDAPPTP